MHPFLRHTFLGQNYVYCMQDFYGISIQLERRAGHGEEDHLGVPISKHI